MITTPKLNIAAWLPQTRVLGPGLRFALWMQGCPFHCPGCLAPSWQSRKRAIIYDLNDFAQKIIQTPDLEGITLSGGEPMLQARALCQLINLVRSKKELSTIAYTGFSLSDLQNSKISAHREILNHLDVLIHGPYIQDLNDNLGLRGSSNQEVSFLSPCYAHIADDFNSSERKIEVHVLEKSILTAGIHPKGFRADLEKVTGRLDGASVRQ